MKTDSSKENKGSDLKASPIIITTIISAIVGLLGTGIGAIIQGSNQTTLEQQKFEANLILKALEPKSQEERANYLMFLVKAGLVKNLNQDSIKDLVKTPSSLPRSNPSDSSPISGTISINSFGSLEKFLAKKDWERANTYTMKILIEMANSSRPNRDFNQDWLEPEDIESLSCSGLRTIDNLWSTASNKRFGFTAQSEIWKKVGGATKTQPDQIDQEMVSARK